MELEEIKTLWAEMSVDMEKQKKLTSLLIMKMTHARYKNKISNILIPETVGALVCFAGMAFIMINFQKLNTWYLLACGIVAVMILLVLTLLSLKSVHKLRSLNITDNNYKKSLLEYSKAKIQFLFVQKMSFFLGSILLLVILPVMGKLIGGMDFFIATRLWLWYAVGFPFFLFFAQWVFKSYRKSAADAENILKELED